jgi:pSer/pThr/pTyr-binding forkhead associated (FHA) protein
MFQAAAPRRRRRRRRTRALRTARPACRRRRCTWCSTTRKYRIDKDQFIIGRGAKSSDLPIKDGNISRKHAAVIRRNGTYFIKDLGSTNGIDYKGMRIDNKRIDEGDVFHLCDYELRFTYKR